MKNKIQKFLWIIAGAETDVLEKCKTDHQRFSVIGITILMTAFIAFLAGTSAAWYFTQSGEDSSGNILGALAFGIVWSMLILSIDRSLIITLKKDPSLPLSKQKYKVALFSRMALGFLVAMMVSIPVELFIFEDYIAQNKIIYHDDKTKEFINNSYNNDIAKEIEDKTKRAEQNKLKKEKAYEKVSGEINEIYSEIERENSKRNHPISSDYKTAKKNRIFYDKQISEKQKQLSQARTYSDSLKIKKVIGDLKYKGRIQKNIESVEIKNWNIRIDEKISSLREVLKEKEKAKDKTSIDISIIDDRIGTLEGRGDSIGSEIEETTGIYTNVLKEGNHFVENFAVLEYSVHKLNSKNELPTELYFLWAIRLLFFIIEIMPTIVKIITPIGTYDRMVDSQEKNMASYLSSSEYADRIANMHNIEMNSKEDILEQQRNIELQIKKDILEKVKEAQMEVADAAIKKWKEQEINNLNSK